MPEEGELPKSHGTTAEEIRYIREHAEEKTGKWRKYMSELKKKKEKAKV